MGYTVAKLRGEMSVRELFMWSAYFSLKNEEEAKAYDDARNKARIGGMR